MKQSNVLYTGFKKASLNDVNSSLNLLKMLPLRKHFLFTNDFDVISEEVTKILGENWDTIIMFGQKPLVKKLVIEKQAIIDGNIYETNYNLQQLQNSLRANNIDYKLSCKAGNSYCNYAYYQMLKQIDEKKLDTRVIFIHIPYLHNFKEMDEVVNFFKNYEPIKEGKRCQK